MAKRRGKRRSRKGSHRYGAKSHRRRHARGRSKHKNPHYGRYLKAKRSLIDNMLEKGRTAHISYSG